MCGHEMKLGGESWGAIGGICVPEALELMTEHRNGNYTLWRGGGGGEESNMRRGGRGGERRPSGAPET